MKKSTLTIIALCGSSIAFAQMPAAEKFTKLPSGLSYAFAKDVDGKKPSIGDYLEMNISFKVADSTIFDSRTVNGDKPVQFQLQAPSFNGDLSEGFKYMNAGDVAYFKISVDSLLKTGGVQPASWMKPNTGQTMDYRVEMMSVKNAEVKKLEDEAAAQKQIATDEKLLTEYFKKNKLKPQRTASGLYYIIHQKGTGNKAIAGNQVTVNYTGSTMDGKVFDSNIDPQFNHVQPFAFTLGEGRVIKGWDEGLALLEKGSKATLYIPSGLAYGPQSPTPAIPPYSVLIFDVELTDITPNIAPTPSGHSEHDGHQH